MIGYRGSLLAVAALLASTAWAQAFDWDSQASFDREQTRQWQRIQAGWRSGDLTQAEYNRMRANWMRVAAMERRAKANGVVTRGERIAMSRELSRSSVVIHSEKIDAERSRPRR